jgi:ribonuclease E
MPVSRLLREQTIGETRWAALDGRGAAVSLYLERASDARRAVIGERIKARVRKIDSGLGGAFVDLGAKGEGFLRLKPDAKLTEGAGVDVEVSAEARGGKLARVRLAGSEAPVSGADFWRASLDGGSAVVVEDRAAGDAEIEAAFDEALAASAVLRGGGRMQLERTEALIAADIDTAGRTARGSRAAGALAINREAAAELARQIHLRSWGGLAVLDCIAPMDSVAGGKVRAAFLDAFRAIANRQVKALAPSAFGLMEISVDWQTTPLNERMAGSEAQALAGLRILEAAARAERMARLALNLPEPAHTWLLASGLDAEGKLAQTYGARLVIRSAPTETPEVTPAP